MNHYKLYKKVLMDYAIQIKDIKLMFDIECITSMERVSKVSKMIKYSIIKRAETKDRNRIFYRCKYCDILMKTKNRFEEPHWIKLPHRSECPYRLINKMP